MAARRLPDGLDVTTEASGDLFAPAPVFFANGSFHIVLYLDKLPWCIDHSVEKSLQVGEWANASLEV